MNIHARTLFALCYISYFLIISSCRNKEITTNDEDKNTGSPVVQKDYLSFIISLDTLPSAVTKKTIYKEDSLLSQRPDGKLNPYYQYFKAKKYSYEKKVDSALIAYQKIKGLSPDDEIELLKKYGILSQTIADGSVVESVLMSRIFAALEASEHAHSRLSYRFYDLLAQAYFQSGNEKKSIEYAAIYFKHHPFNNHPIIKQRYFEISFLLASRLGDFNKMSYYNTQARQLAEQVGDSLAIATSYNNEAQIYNKQSQHSKALVSSKIFFNYLKKSDNMNDVAYNNLATSFLRNNQPDSAIKYYKEGILIQKRDSPAKQKEMYYNGLVAAFKMKGDFVHALEAADSAYTIELRNYQAVEAVKVAEMHEQYETEKKDQNIMVLNGRNKLNETIIKQQRWTLFLTLLVFLGLISFFYAIYRQQLLSGKNKLLKSENQRLNVEQKMLQAQLNPHFIFNSIANLQSLIASGQTEISALYLKSFSGLLRGILEQNRKDFIEIEEEIGSLNNYLQLQQMRYADAFDYKILTDDQLNVNETLIPPMLIQPFVENAIEHGFRNIAYKGLLSISFKIKNDLLVIEIDDNGSGLIQKTEENINKQSLAQVILKERIDLLFIAKRQYAAFKVTDKGRGTVTGVFVEIQIPIINN